MPAEIKVGSRTDPMSNETTVWVSVPHELNNLEAVYARKMFAELVAEKLAEKYVEEKYAELLGSLNPVAVANLAIAKAAGMVAESFAPKTEKR